MFNIEKYERFIKKCEEISDFNFVINHRFINYEKKETNCYGFASHLFPFLKKSTPSKLSIDRVVNKEISLKILKEPIDYCFIFCLSPSGFYTHIAIYVNNRVFEFSDFGYRNISYKNFLIENKNVSYFIAIDKYNNNLNNLTTFQENI